MKRAITCLIPLSVLLLVGCFPDPIEEIRKHEFQAGMTLEQSYNTLLDNVSWQKVKHDGGSYVEVRGIVKGTTNDLAVRYETKPRPPVVHSFGYKGQSGNAAAFSTLLYKIQLRRAITAGPGGGA